MITIRYEKPEDRPFANSVIEKAFKRDAEARLADKLRLKSLLITCHC
ncbi:MAG: hypothetical protein JRD19_06330 [Deltaproteobacteria bacterium]|nr:hypothetical protein [Deltaproteobacteria bacterium]